MANKWHTQLFDHSPAGSPSLWFSFLPFPTVRVLLSLDERIREVSTQKPEGSDLSLRAFVDAWWKPYLQRKGVKLSTKSNYDSVLQLHVLPAFGDMRMEEIVPLHVERFVQTKPTSGLSAKTVRNLLLVLQAILSLAVDNDLIARSPIRKRHKSTVDR